MTQAEAHEMSTLVNFETGTIGVIHMRINNQISFPIGTRLRRRNFASWLRLRKACSQQNNGVPQHADYF